MGEAERIKRRQTPALQYAEVDYIFLTKLVDYTKSFFPVLWTCQNCRRYFVNTEVQSVRFKKTLIMIFQICLIFEGEETELALIGMVYIPIIWGTWRMLIA